MTSMPSMSAILPSLPAVPEPSARPHHRADNHSSGERHPSHSDQPAGTARTRNRDGHGENEDATRDKSAAGGPQEFLATLAAAMATPAHPRVSTSPSAAPAPVANTVANTAAGGPGAAARETQLRAEAGLGTAHGRHSLDRAALATKSTPFDGAASVSPASTRNDARPGTASNHASPSASNTVLTPGGTPHPLPAAAAKANTGESGTDSGQNQRSDLASSLKLLSAENGPARADSTATAASTPATAGQNVQSPAALVGTTDPKAVTTAEAVTRQVFPEITRFSQTAAPGTHRLSITLHPEDLGEVKVTMIVRAGTLQVQLTAETPAARAALTQGSSELHRMLELISSPDTRVVVRDASGASTESRTGSDSAGAQSQHNAASGQNGHDSGRNAASQSADEWAQGWTSGTLASGPTRPRNSESPAPAAVSTAATTNPGRLDRLM